MWLLKNCECIIRIIIIDYAWIASLHRCIVESCIVNYTNPATILRFSLWRTKWTLIRETSFLIKKPGFSYPIYRFLCSIIRNNPKKNYNSWKAGFSQQKSSFCGILFGTLLNMTMEDCFSFLAVWQSMAECFSRAYHLGVWKRFLTIQSDSSVHLQSIFRKYMCHVLMMNKISS